MLLSHTLTRWSWHNLPPPMQSVTIILPHPPAAVRPNARVHWARKAQAVKAYRTQSKVYTMQQLAGQKPMWKKARVLITWEAIHSMAPDPDNIVASMKAAFDGMQDAGVVVNDRGIWPERPVIVKNRPWPQVVLTITEETD